MAHRSAEELEAERLMIEDAQRDRAAFAPLYERYVDQIYAYAHTLTRNRELAEDVTASTFAKAIEDLPALRVARCAVLGLAVPRGGQHGGATGAPAGLGRPRRAPARRRRIARGIVEQRDREAMVRAAVAKLPDDQRQAVLLRFGGELRNREIGEVMGRSEGAVKLLTFRAMTSLRRQLGAPLPAERSDGGTRVNPADILDQRPRPGWRRGRAAVGERVARGGGRGR